MLIDPHHEAVKADQWFFSFTLPQNSQMVCYSTLFGYTPEFLILWVWGGTWDSTSLTSSLKMLCFLSQNLALGSKTLQSSSAMLLDRHWAGQGTEMDRPLSWTGANSLYRLLRLVTQSGVFRLCVGVLRLLVWERAEHGDVYVRTETPPDQ